MSCRVGTTRWRMAALFTMYKQNVFHETPRYISRPLFFSSSLSLSLLSSSCRFSLSLFLLHTNPGQRWLKLSHLLISERVFSSSVLRPVLSCLSHSAASPPLSPPLPPPSSRSDPLRPLSCFQTAADEFKSHLERHVIELQSADYWSDGCPLPVK